MSIKMQRLADEEWPKNAAPGTYDVHRLNLPGRGATHLIIYICPNGHHCGVCIGPQFEGLRNKEVGATLGIAEGTVQIHVKNIFSKLNVNDRTAAVQVAVRRGLIQMR